jgi:hypothetical protein
MDAVDPAVVEQYADFLYRKAAARVTGYALVGTALGLLLGAIAGGKIHLTSQPLIPAHLGYATMLIGGAALGAFGYRLGGRASYGIRLQAQITLHQLQLGRAIAPSPPVTPAPPLSPPLSPPVSAPAPAPVAPVAAPVPQLAPIQAPLLAPPAPPAPAVAAAPVPLAPVPLSPIPPRQDEGAQSLPPLTPLTPPVSTGR